MRLVRGTLADYVLPRCYCCQQFAPRRTRPALRVPASGHSRTASRPTIGNAAHEFAIRPYRDSDERGWFECRVLSFLDSAFFDDVRQAKERYERPAIELVAERADEIVGLIDVECEDVLGTVCEDRPGLGGMIWHLAVHADHQQQGVATELLREAERLARKRGVVRFEAWTRDDPGTQAWYESRGFSPVHSYLHVYVELHGGLRDQFPVSEDGLRLVKVFAHYLGDDRGAMRERFARVHDDVLDELRFS